jgi:hypothetical protein
MNTKLTLSLEKEVIEQAKIYAKGSGRSLSEMVESYFRSLVAKNSLSNTSKEEIDDKLKRITGIVSLPEDFDEKKAVQEYLEQKYLK